MKHLLITALICCATVCLSAQTNEKTIKRINPEVSDIFDALKSMGTTIFRFDLSAFTDQEYFITPFYESYSIQDDGSHEKDNSTGFTFLSRGKSKGYATIMTTIADTTAKVGVNIAGICSFNMTYPLKRIGKSQTVYYDVRPFSFEPITQTDSLHIPLVFLASSWEDGEVNRFCGDNELAPDMSSDLMKLSPHYYVIGIGIRK